MMEVVTVCTLFVLIQLGYCEVPSDFPRLSIKSNLPSFYVGDNIYLNCSVAVKKNTSFLLEWTYSHVNDNDTSVEEGYQQLESKPNYDFLFRTLNITNARESHEGLYTCELEHKYSDNYTEINKDHEDTEINEDHEDQVYITVNDPKPSVDLYGLSIGAFYEVNKEHTLQCVADGKFLPDITWIWINCTDWNVCGEEIILQNQPEVTTTNYSKKASDLTVTAYTSGIFCCKANNSFGENNKSAPLIVTDIPDGKAISLTANDRIPKKYSEIKIYCQVTSFVFENITWSFIQVPGNYNMVAINDLSGAGYSISKEPKLKTSYSERSILKFQASNNRSGLYGCTYHDKRYDTLVDKFIGIYINIDPPPSIPETNFTTDAPSNKLDTTIVTIISVVVVAALLIIVTIIAVMMKIRKKNLKFNPYNLQAGQLSLINPNLPLEDQVELLPYDPRWEFPKDRLKLGRVIGHGAFGRVVKADAIGLESHVPYTTVAIKMLKDKNDEGQYKSLMAELKIMIHLGRHVNILNLMGAVTKNLYKGELMVMVEYCCHGNLRSYLLKHREKFINQIDPETGKVNQDILFENILQSTEENNERFDYSKPIFFGISNPSYNYSSTSQLIKNTGSNSAEITGDSTTTTCTTGGESSIGTIGGSESGYSSTGEAVNLPLSAKEAARYSGILTTSDLLCYCFQCAQGMSYLASRKLLHRDLAARNILLAERNVIKIADFGLSKDVYKYSKYVKKADGPLPVKWMAIESIRDRIFTIKSDVWSFGVLMWEIFTLGGNPYPGFEMNERFFKRLQEGYRLEKPEYSPADVYQIMLDCWQSNPKDRPDFSYLGEKIGEMLEATVKEHYIELNGPYAELNKDLRTLEDYLTMSTANYLDMNTSVQETNIDNTNLPIPDYMSFTDLNSAQKQKSPYYNIPPTIQEQPNVECSLDENTKSDMSVQMDCEEVETAASAKETPDYEETEETVASAKETPDYEETEETVASAKKTPHEENLSDHSNLSTDVEAEESSTDKIKTKNPDYLVMT